MAQNSSAVNLFSYSSIGQKLGTGLTGLKLRHEQASISFRRTHAFAFPASRGHRHSLARGGFLPLQSLQCSYLWPLLPSEGFSDHSWETFSLLRAHVIRFGPPDNPESSLHREFIILTTFAKSCFYLFFSWLCMETYLQVLHIRVWTSLRGHYSAYHTSKSS